VLKRHQKYQTVCLKDCVTNRASAIEAVRAVYRLDCAIEDLGECSQTLRTFNCRVTLPSGVALVSRDPNWRGRITRLMHPSLRLGEGCHHLKQISSAAAFLKDGIGSSAGREFIFGKRTAHGNYPNLREAAKVGTKASVPCKESQICSILLRVCGGSFRWCYSSREPETDGSWASPSGS
jgi:hypothetical protein